MSGDDRERAGLRIFFLVPSLAVGGAETQLTHLAEGLAARGHEVTVAVHYSGGALEGRLHGARLVRLDKAGRWDLAGFALRLVRAVRACGPDVVCTFLGTPNILAAALRPWIRPARLAWTVRCSDMDLSRYDWAVRFAARTEAFLSPLADLIMVNSQAGRDVAVRRGMAPGRMVVVVNGFDSDRFAPDPAAGARVRAEWGMPGGAPLVGLAARLDPMKDHETFLAAARLVAGRDEAVRFVCVGDGPLRAGLAARSRALGLDDRLLWAGERRDMAAVYNALDVCCLASITEGFPNVLGEAMACGVPCVTTDVGDAARLVGATGTVVPPRDPEALADGILETLGRVRNGRAPDTRARIVDEYSLAAMVGRVEGLFREMARDR